MAIAAGTRFNHYEISAQLGAGGMGEVYRARDTRLDREVAIKVLPAAYAQDADRLRRFEQEACATDEDLAGLVGQDGILSLAWRDKIPSCPTGRRQVKTAILMSPEQVRGQDADHRADIFS